MAEPVFNYCPTCAAPLVDRAVAGAVRRACPACSFVHFLDPKVAAVVVVEHGGRVLLDRRNIDPGKGRWSFVGGYVDRGEPVEVAAVREVKEETNLDVDLAALLGVYSEPGNPTVVVAYRARVRGGAVGDLQAQAQEVGELAFFSPDALPELAFPIDAAILRAWRAAR